MKAPIEEPVRCIYCGLWVDLEDGKNLVRMDADGWLMAAHPPCLKQHRPDAQIDGVALENPGDFEAPGRGRKVSGSAPGTPVKRASETTASDHSDGSDG